MSTSQPLRLSSKHLLNPSEAYQAAMSTTPALASPIYDWKELYKDDPIQPKPFQIRTANSILEGNDTILVAPTGTGKGVIFDMLHRARPKEIWVIILPLKALEEEMVVRLASISSFSVSPG
jgi:Lhr-like helicase